MSALEKTLWMVEDYLAFERDSQEKHEFVDGEVYLMTGASRQHNLIVANVLAALHQQLRARPCEVYASDMRVRVQRYNFVYPDVVVVCGEPRFGDEVADTLLNPTVVIEVLSPSTELYDRGRKFHNYRTLDSLQEYLLIAQDAYRIERFLRRADGQWLFTDVTALDAVLELPSIECKLAVADVYDKVEFEAPAAGSQQPE